MVPHLNPVFKKNPTLRKAYWQLEKERTNVLLLAIFRIIFYQKIFEGRIVHCIVDFIGGAVKSNTV